MPLTQTICLLPCHTLEDFPIHLRGADAAGLLAAWSGLWHPAIVAAAGNTPIWQRADSPGYEFADRLIAIPAVSRTHLPDGWRDQALLAGAAVVEGFANRSEFLDRALSFLSAFDPTPGAAKASPGEATESVSLNRDGPSVAAMAGHFLALGFCRLQVELLTRRMRYTSTIDESRLSQETVAAASAWQVDDAALARHHLQAAFDLLLAARQYFYPVDSYLIDLALVWPTTAGQLLLDDLAAGAPLNLLMTGETLEILSASQPDTIAAIRAAMEADRVTVVGGEWAEPELPLLLPELCLESFGRGRAAFAQHLGRVPTIYGRRKFGLGPMMPQLLSRFGYHGALHAVFDDGRMPSGGRAKIRWEGQGMSSLDAIATTARDAGAIESMLGLAASLGETMDNDHVATLLLVHWPGGGSQYWHDLKLSTQYAPVLGKLITLSDYFSETDSPGQIAAFAADRYATPYLQQAIDRKQLFPLSGGQAARRASIAATCRSAVDLLTATIGRADRSAAAGGPLDATAESSIRALAACLPRGHGAPEPAVFAVNPFLHPWQMLMEPALPAASEPGEAAFGPVAIEVPPLGFARLTIQQLRAMQPKHPIKVDGQSISNEYLQVVIHSETGGIKAIYDDRHRGNRLSQQLAVREYSSQAPPGEVWREPELIYSTMKAASIRVVAAGPWLGEIESRGVLIDSGGAPIANFSQRTRLAAGSRVVELILEWSAIETLRADPWNSYVAVRWAWPRDDYRVSRGIGLAKEDTTAKLLEAPDYLQLETETGAITLLPGGLPYHVRTTERRLDTLLQVRGETRTAQRLGVGFDLPSPAATSLAFDAPPGHCTEQAPPLAGSASSWLFQISERHVVATWWSPLCAPGDAAPRGFRVRLLETLGRAGVVYLQAFRPVIEARQIDFTAQPLVHLRVEDGKIRIDLAAREWVEIEAIWSD